MLNKIILIISFLFIIPKDGSSQEYMFHAGMTHSWITYKDSEIEKQYSRKFNPGFDFAFFYKQNITEIYYLNVGMRYFRAGDKSTFSFKDQYMENYFFEYNSEGTLTHDYISFPIQICYNLTENISPFINIEPAIHIKSVDKGTFTIRAENTSEGMYSSDEESGNYNQILTPYMNKFNFFIGCGIRYIFEFEQIKLGLSGQVNFGILRVTKDGEQSLFGGDSIEYPEWRTQEISAKFEIYF